MKIEEIRELVTLLEESRLNVLEISEGDSRIRLEKAPLNTGVPFPTQMMMPGMAVGMPTSGETGQNVASADGGATTPVATAAAPSGKAVKSPMVGVFYGAAAPGEAAFVSVGSRIEKGDVLCIVEAMKLMNEITAEISGEVTEICAADGDVVEFGQPLFYIK